MSNLKILYFSSFGSMKGGGQESLLLLFSYLERDRYTPYCVTPEKGSFTDKLDDLAIKNYVIPMGPTKSFNLPRIICTISNILKIIRNNDINIIHTDGPRNTFYAGIAAKVLRIPVITHIRVTDKPRFNDRIMTMLTDYFIFVSEAAKKRFYWRGNKKPSKVIYNSIDVKSYDKFQLENTSKFNRKDQKNNIQIGCIGRIEREKGQIYLIQAAQKIVVKYPKTKFIFIGEAESDYLEQLMSEASPIKENIIFEGYVKTPYNIMKDMDIIVLPSLSEGFSRVILESMAMRKPVIATDVGGNPEAVIDGQTGFLVKTRDHDAISSRIIELLESTEKRIEMGEMGYRRVNDLFRIKTQVKKIEDIYDMLVTN